MSREIKTILNWTGEIPETWSVSKLKNIGKFKASGINKLRDKDEVDVKIVNYVDVFNSKTHQLYNNNYMLVTEKDEKINENLLFKGDLLFTPSSETIEDIGISALVEEDLENTSFSYHLLRFRFTHPIIHSYRKYLTNNHFVRNQFSRKTTGTIRKTLNRNDFNQTLVILPPMNEQDRIATVLDRKTTEIDNIVEKTKQSIEELKAYKQSLITEVVTKGLNPDAPMKDSGIEWIDKIPEHWHINMINNYFYELKSKNKNMIENNLLSLSYGNIIRRNIETTNGLLPASFENYNILKKGDIVLRMTDLQNDKKSLRTGYVTERGIITSAYITLRTKHVNTINSRYTQLYLHSFDIHKGFYGMGGGVRQSVNYNDLKKTPILVPPIEEQTKIVKFLIEKNQQIDNVISKKQQMIKELESYKQSLIYEYVTGKKEVK